MLGVSGFPQSQSIYERASIFGNEKFDSWIFENGHRKDRHQHLSAFRRTTSITSTYYVICSRYQSQLCGHNQLQSFIMCFLQGLWLFDKIINFYSYKLWQLSQILPWFWSFLCLYLGITPYLSPTPLLDHREIIIVDLESFKRFDIDVEST